MLSVSAVDTQSASASAAAAAAAGAGGSVIQLHRVSQVADRLGAQNFSFILPSGLLRGFNTEAKSRDFTFGGLSWVVQFERVDRHLAAHLVLLRPTQNLLVSVDFTFTLLNREHFTKNESFTDVGARFGAECSKRGRAHYITLIDLQQRCFLFDNQTALLDVELRNLQVTFSQTLQLPSMTRKDARGRVDIGQENRIDSSFFTFGGCEWNVVVQTIAAPTAAKLLNPKSGLRVYLQRHSHLDFWCKVRYQIALTYDSGTVPSGESSRMLEECIESASLVQQFATQPAQFRTVKVEVKLFSFAWITDVQLVPTNNTKNATRFYDKEGQQWLLDCDLLGTFVKLRMYYIDVKNIPRASIRALRWNTFILPQDSVTNTSSTNSTNPAATVITSRSGSLQNFYAQKEFDDGCHILMDALVEKLLDKSIYISAENGSMRVRIEWLSSFLLHNDSYTLYDSLSSEHRLQTKREMQALQAENYSLEKQIFFYQQAIAKNNARAQSPTNATTNGPHGVGPVPSPGPGPGPVSGPEVNFALTPVKASTSTPIVNNNHNNHNNLSVDDSPRRSNSASETNRMSRATNGIYARRSTSPCPVVAELSVPATLHSDGPSDSTPLGLGSEGSQRAPSPQHLQQQPSQYQSHTQANSRSTSSSTLNRLLPRVPDENGSGLMPSPSFPRVNAPGQSHGRASVPSHPSHRGASRTASYEPQPHVRQVNNGQTQLQNHNNNGQNPNHQSPIVMHGNNNNGNNNNGNNHNANLGPMEGRKASLHYIRDPAVMQKGAFSLSSHGSQNSLLQ